MNGCMRTGGDGQESLLVGIARVLQLEHTPAKPTRPVSRTSRIHSGWLVECEPLAMTTSSWPARGFMTSSRMATSPLRS